MKQEKTQMNRNEDINKSKIYKKAIVVMENCGIRMNFIRNKKFYQLYLLITIQSWQIINYVTKVAERVGNYLLFTLGNKDHVLVCCEDDEALPLTLATKRTL